MPERAMILDRDGTINIDSGYVHKIEDFKFIPGTFHALSKFQENFFLFIYTNQAGIGYGLYSEEEFKKVNNYMLNRLKAEGIEIKKVLYCPHRPEDNCECRKPKTGLLEQLIHNYSIDRKKSYVVGDKTVDIKFGENAGMNTILVETGKTGMDGEYDVKPMFIFKDLLAASLVI